MISIKQKDLLLAAGILTGLLAVYLLSGFLETRRAEFGFKADEDDLSLQGERLRGYALGFEGLLADWYWVRSLQYIGDKIHNAKDKKINIEDLRPLDPKLLYPLLNNAATLDPNFLAVYSYGATVLPAINEKHAIEITRKGIENNPGEWQLYHQLGYIYWRLKDFEKAADIYEKGSAINGAPDWMASMSARMRTQGGSRETARRLYQLLAENASDSQTRSSAELRLKQLDSMDEIDVLNEALSDFKKANGRCAAEWREITGRLIDRTLANGRVIRVDAQGRVVDPTDAPYLIDRETCKAKPDPMKTGLPKD